MSAELPTIAIIGRPNTGKSTLFNRFIGEQRSIESDIAGTTRDSLIEKVTLEKYSFFLVDTAGLTDSQGDSLEDEIQSQAELALENADMLLFLVDARSELTQDDYRLAERLRKGKKPLLFVANKVDDGDESKTWHLSELGLGMPMCLSAKNNFGIYEFEDLVEEKLEKLGFPAITETQEADDGSLKIAFVGRPNVGKSSLFNAFLDNNRSVVSNVAGTTRDTIDTKLYYNPETKECSTEAKDGFSENITLLDTAGLRRPGKVDRGIEFWSTVRTRRAIERADVCCLLIDALDGVAHQDLTIAGEIVEAGKGVILCVNKFDLVQEKSRTQDETDDREVAEVKMWGEELDNIRRNYLNYLSQKIRFLNWAPVLFFSAKTGKGIGSVFENAQAIQTERTKRIATADLNRFIPEIYFGHVQPSVGTKIGKIKYVSQVTAAPPKFLFHVNNAQAFHFTYRRYAENKLREKYGFHGTPIEVEFRDAMDKFKGKK